MTLDAYVKMVTCECWYFQGDETFDVHAASSLQEFSEKKHEVLQCTSWHYKQRRQQQQQQQQKTSTSGD